MLQAIASQYNSFLFHGSSNGHISAGVLVPLIIAVAILGILEVVGLWKVLTKAGRPGWVAIIPLYNLWVLFEISGKPGWWALFILLSVIPAVGWIIYFVLYIIAMLKLTKCFGKEPIFSVLLIILPFVGFSILGFGDARYRRPVIE